MTFARTEDAFAFLPSSRLGERVDIERVNLPCARRASGSDSQEMGVATLSSSAVRENRETGLMRRTGSESFHRLTVKKNKSQKQGKNIVQGSIVSLCN